VEVSPLGIPPITIGITDWCGFCCSFIVWDCCKRGWTRVCQLAQREQHDYRQGVDIEFLDLDNYEVPAHKQGLWTTTGEDTTEASVDQEALALICLNVKDYHLTTLDACNSAKEAWDTLEEIYKARSVATKLQLKKELNNLKKGPSEPLPKYIARAKTIWNDLLATGHDIKPSVLAGLPKEYEILIAIMEASDKELDLDKVQESFCMWRNV